MLASNNRIDTITTERKVYPGRQYIPQWRMKFKLGMCMLRLLQLLSMTNIPTKLPIMQKMRFLQSGQVSFRVHHRRYLSREFLTKKQMVLYMFSIPVEVAIEKLEMCQTEKGMSRDWSSLQHPFSQQEARKLGFVILLHMNIKPWSFSSWMSTPTVQSLHNLSTDYEMICSDYKPTIE